MIELIGQRFPGKTETLGTTVLRIIGPQHDKDIAVRQVNKDGLLINAHANNVGLFMEASEYIEHNAETCISSIDLISLYKLWCDENSDLPVKNKTFIEQLKANQDKYGIQYTNNVTNREGRRVRGFKGLNAVISVMNSWPQADPEDHPLKKE